MRNQQIDWSAEATKALAMTDAEIHAALADILSTLDSADSLDRVTGDDRGGFYRDQCSVLRQELKKRESSIAYRGMSAAARDVRSGKIDVATSMEERECCGFDAADRHGYINGFKANAAKRNTFLRAYASYLRRVFR